MSEHPWGTTPPQTDRKAGTWPGAAADRPPAAPGAAPAVGAGDAATTAPPRVGRGRDRPARGRRPGASSVLAACGALVVGLLGGLGIGTAVASPTPATDGSTGGTTAPGQGTPGGQGGSGGWLPGGASGSGSTDQVPGGPPPGAVPGGGTAPDGTTGTLPDGSTPGSTTPGSTAPDGGTSDGVAGGVGDPVTYVVRTTSAAGGPGDVPPPHAMPAAAPLAVVERRQDA